MKNILFIDRDGTLVVEPPIDKQLDSLEKLEFLPGVFSALKILKKLGYTFVMVSNQDGLGTNSFPQVDFEKPQQKMLDIFKVEDIEFEEIFICPHFDEDNCNCRKPKTGLLDNYIQETEFDPEKSFVIGDRLTDLELAKNLNLGSILIGEIKDDIATLNADNWEEIVDFLKSRKASFKRKTKETDIKIELNLDGNGKSDISTGLGFFDHMLEQIAKHSGIDLELTCNGDLEVDEHHTVEDCGIALGQCFSEALGDKRGITRYGFLLPMDESLAQVALDFSGRAYCVFDCEFTREMIGDMPTEMIEHFFRSFAEGSKMTLNISCQGKNNHHMAEACFKGLAKALGQAIERNLETMTIPSSKGTL